jgi:hypothetical protein
MQQATSLVRTASLSLMITIVPLVNTIFARFWATSPFFPALSFLLGAKRDLKKINLTAEAYKSTILMAPSILGTTRMVLMPLETKFAS